MRSRKFKTTCQHSPLYLDCLDGVVFVGDFMFRDAKTVERLAAAVSEAAKWLAASKKKAKGAK